MHALTGRAEYGTIAAAAVRWLVRNVQANGTIPLS
jgi:hypothetical protein